MTVRDPSDRGARAVSGAMYEIVVRGRFDGTLAKWFSQLEVVAGGPDETFLRGWFPDQPALQAVLTELADLGVELSSFRRLPDPD